MHVLGRIRVVGQSSDGQADRAHAILVAQVTAELSGDRFADG
jgi:hypothetical protein